MGKQAGIVRDFQSTPYQILKKKNFKFRTVSLFFYYFIQNKNNKPVVSAGVHSCSPVAPHNKVNVLDGSTVTVGPAGECNVVDFRSKWH